MRNKEEILKALEQVQDPELHKNIVELGMVKNLEVIEVLRFKKNNTKKRQMAQKNKDTVSVLCLTTLSQNQKISSYKMEGDFLKFPKPILTKINI